MSRILIEHYHSIKKRLNVESPSFTPLQPVPNGLTSNNATISPNATSAPVFTPRSSRPGAFALIESLPCITMFCGNDAFTGTAMR